MNRMNVEVLERIGLSRAEINIYQKLLQLGSVPSARVVKETGFRKSTVYDTIRRLQEKGLVSYVIRDNMKHFEAADPERLIDFLEDREREIEGYKEDVRQIIPKLRKTTSTFKPHAEAHVLVGVEGFKTMRRDVIKNSEGELLLLGAIRREDEVMPGFFKNWNISRQLKKIQWRTLYKESARKKEKKARKEIGKYYKTRFLGQEITSPAVINIYGNRVVNVLWKDKEPLCFMLINKDIADSHRQYFNYLWKRAKR